MTVNFNDDLPLLRAHVAARVEAQSHVDEPISAVQVGFRLVQACLVVFYFDTRELHDRDGQWDFDEPTLELPHWNEAFEAAEEDGLSCVLLSGERLDLPAGTDEETVAAIFGQTLLAVALDATAAGSFDALPLRDDCQLDLEEFDGLWAWPPTYDAVGRSNLLHALPALRLPG